MWIFLALAASFMWGFHYVISEQVYKKISVLAALAISTTLAGIALFVVAAMMNVLKRDIHAISESRQLLYLVIAQTGIFFIAELFIGLSIAGKNATLAGFIEISYPFFIALLTYALFKESTLGWATAAGGLLIFLGVLVIFNFSK